jgi:hypothetical protein
MKHEKAIENLAHSRYFSIFVTGHNFVPVLDIITQDPSLY